MLSVVTESGRTKSAYGVVEKLVNEPQELPQNIIDESFQEVLGQI